MSAGHGGGGKDERAVQDEGRDLASRGGDTRVTVKTSAELAGMGRVALDSSLISEVGESLCFGETLGVDGHASHR